MGRWAVGDDLIYIHIHIYIFVNKQELSFHPYPDHFIPLSAPRAVDTEPTMENSGKQGLICSCSHYPAVRAGWVSRVPEDQDIS